MFSFATNRKSSSCLVLRQGSAQLFNSRKTFTALKSCYHRNLDVFKQIYAFEAFLAKAAPLSPQLDPANPPSPSSSTSNVGQREMQDIIDDPLPAAFSTPVQRQNFLERKLDAARSLNVPIGNLTIRVLDHWQDLGWYVLFKRRFKHDHRTGLPVPRHASSRHSEAHPSFGLSACLLHILSLTSTIYSHIQMVKGMMMMKVIILVVSPTARITARGPPMRLILSPTHNVVTLIRRIA